MNKQYIIRMLSVSGVVLATMLSMSSYDGVAHASDCKGEPAPPKWLQSTFLETHNDDLLNQALGKPLQGGLCQGKVYTVQKNIRLYRSWNSTNPGSKLGVWWSFFPPQGAIEDYRKEYEICYQWSPLDRLVSCELKAGRQVVIGNGQSAECSPYLTYPTSPGKQIYVPDPKSAFSECQSSTGVFSWRAR